MTEHIAKPEHLAIAPGEPPVVDVQGLWTTFGKGDEAFTVHQDLQLSVQRGEILALVGGSGTGKTVLLRQMLGLAQPTRGRVTVLGQPASEMGREGAASRVGMLFQQGALFSAFNVLDNVAFALREQGTLPADVVRDAALVKLQMVGLKPEHAIRMPADLSGVLADWLKLADTLPVHDLLDRIYFHSNLLERYRAAVPEALQGAVAANLHAYLELALATDSGRYPSLAKFLRQIAELRRASDQEAPDEGAIGDSANAVRIHTVHEAKGLESPVIWLLDANAAPNPDRGYRVLLDWPPEDPAPRHFSLYTTSAALTPQQRSLLEDEAAIAARENLNLLYVAMTRAKQALLVSGCETRKGSGSSWHAKLQSAAGEDAGSIAPIFETVLPAAPAAETPAAVTTDPRLNTPLSVGQREQAEQTPQQRFGIRLHALLEWLAPPDPVADKAVLQDRLELEHDEFEPLWQEAQAVLQAPHLQAFFDPALYRRAWNELPYRNAAGEIRRIDRLVERDDAFWVLDYKAAEGAANPAKAAAPYLGQLAEYRSAVAAAFPGKPVRCALVFKGGVLHEVGP